MKIIMDSTAREVTESAANGILAVAQRYVRRGVYAVKKDDVIELRHDRCPTKKKVEELVEDFEGRGYTVYANY